MKLIDIKRRFRRLNLVDLTMVKALWIIVGVIIATYFISLRGFVEQNIYVVIFLMIVIGVKPVIKFFKK
jgi:hypothetical protein|tara:strand:- start:203 stop:409 length:207 start_codon:yes stop_codon:yes gene_type:complete